jgi:hypothetical protein
LDNWVLERIEWTLLGREGDCVNGCGMTRAIPRPQVLEFRGDKPACFYPERLPDE